MPCAGKRRKTAVIELAGKKIIVTFLMHLGDLVLTTPFLHALRQAAGIVGVVFEGRELA